MKLISGGIYSEKNSSDTCIVYLGEYEKKFYGFYVGFLSESQFSFKYINELIKKVQLENYTISSNFTFFERETDMDIYKMTDGYIGKIDKNSYDDITLELSFLY